MKARRIATGKVLELRLERYSGAVLANVKDWLDTYQPGFDDKLIEVVDATPNERRALRRAGFNIERAA